MYFKIFMSSVCLLNIVNFSLGGQEEMTECLQKYPNLKAEDVFGNFKTKGEILDENNIDAKCVFLCVTMKNGMADSTGAIDTGKLKTKFTDAYSSKMKPEDVSALVDKCASSRTEIDPCDRVYQFHKCHMKAFLAI